MNKFFFEYEGTRVVGGGLVFDSGALTMEREGIEPDLGAFMNAVRKKKGEDFHVTKFDWRIIK